MHLGVLAIETGRRGNIVSLLYAPAVTYYFMPINLYLTGAIGASRVGLDYGGDNSDWGNFGVGLNLDVGKEWWVGDDLGVGLAGRFWYTHATRELAGLKGTDSFTGWALLFSGTYQ